MNSTYLALHSCRFVRSIYGVWASKANCAGRSRDVRSESSNGTLHIDRRGVASWVISNVREDRHGDLTVVVAGLRVDGGCCAARDGTMR